MAEQVAGPMGLVVPIGRVEGAGGFPRSRPTREAVGWVRPGSNRVWVGPLVGEEAGWDHSTASTLPAKPFSPVDLDRDSDELLVICVPVFSGEPCSLSGHVSIICS